MSSGDAAKSSFSQHDSLHRDLAKLKGWIRNTRDGLTTSQIQTLEGLLTNELKRTRADEANGAYDGRHVLVAVTTDAANQSREVVGVMMYAKSGIVTRNSSHCHIVVIDPAHRKRGIFSCLITTWLQTENHIQLFEFRLINSKAKAPWPFRRVLPSYLFTL